MDIVYYGLGLLVGLGALAVLVVLFDVAKQLFYFALGGAALGALMGFMIDSVFHTDMVFAGIGAIIGGVLGIVRGLNTF